MAHYVKCMYCNKSFDRDKVPFKQINRRYAHFECWIRHESNKSQDDKDKDALEEYIKKLFNEPYVNAKIKKQILQFREEYQYSYSGIRKALIYAFEVKRMDISQSNGGIGIVPYVYKDAYNYYYALWLAHQKNKDKELSDYIPQKTEIRILNPERSVMRKKKFGFLDEEESDGE